MYKEASYVPMCDTYSCGVPPPPPPPSDQYQSLKYNALLVYHRSPLWGHSVPGSLDGQIGALNL